MQETKTLTLPVSQKKVVVKGYMTGRIDQEVQKILLGGSKTSYDVSPEDVKASMNSGDDPTPTVHISDDPTVQIDAKNKKIELMVISLDGVSDNVLDQVLDLPKEDVDYILEQLNAVENASKVVSSDPKVPLS